jgi:hypothetical protein
MIDAHDLIVAATALQRQSQVVTLNRKHFDQVPGLKVIVPRLVRPALKLIRVNSCLFAVDFLIVDSRSALICGCPFSCVPCAFLQPLSFGCIRDCAWLSLTVLLS